jgi:hypothetical protein
MRALCGNSNNFYTFVFKNFLLPEMQVEFDRCLKLTYDLSKDDLLEEHPEYDTPLWERVVNYAYETPVEMHIPMTCFPLLLVEKESKMKYANFPHKEIDIEEFHDKCVEYLLSLDVRQLRVPPPEVLIKYNTTRFHDDGEVKQDFEPASKVNSGFMYQKFLTKPLTPREVWLPDKRTKMCNSFWMLIGRQILKRDPIYPSLDPQKNHERISGFLDDTIRRFDVSGFGFQYQRDLLLAVAACICEVFPSNILDQEYQQLFEILKDFKLLLPSGLYVVPPRGIGLGYFEDLKTIGIMALLFDQGLISVYGDQGIFVDSYHLDEHLREGSIIIHPSKIENIPSGKILWGGVIYEKDTYHKPKEVSAPLIGSIFSSFHWERKESLKSLSFSLKDYKKYQLKIAFFSQLFFGYELRVNDYFESIGNLGVMVKQYVEGYTSSCLVEGAKHPSLGTKLNMKYIDPYHTIQPKTSLSIKKSFSKTRKNLFKKSKNIDSLVYRYIYPRIEYNYNSSKAKVNFPFWGDLLLALLYESTVGVVTFGLTPEEILLAPTRQAYADNPFRAKSLGGYKVLTADRGFNIATSENQEVAEFLASLNSNNLSHIARADLMPTATQIDEDESLGKYYFRPQKSLKRTLALTLADERQSTQDSSDFSDHISKKVKEFYYSTESDAVEAMRTMIRDESMKVFRSNVDQEDDEEPYEMDSSDEEDLGDLLLSILPVSNEYDW